MILNLYKQLEAVANTEFSDIIEATEIIFSYTKRPRKLRIWLIDSTFVDVWYSLDSDYSFHWQQSDEQIYRHDNAPHKSWALVKTFPKHCHEISQEKVIESNIPDTPQEAIRYFLDIIRKKLVESYGK